MSAAIIPGKLILAVAAVGGDSRTSVLAGTVDDPGISCDTVADLPSTTYFDGYTLLQGSTAHVITDNTIYTMLSDGTWILQDVASRMDVYTKPQIDSMFSDYTTTANQMLIDGAQDDDIDKNYNAIEYITDNCVQKNVLPKVKRIGTSNANAAQSYVLGGITFTVNADGTITISRDTAGSSQAVWFYDDSSAIHIDDFCTGDFVFSTGMNDENVQIRVSDINSGSYWYCRTAAIIPDRGAYTNINVSISVAAAFSGTVTMKPMICHKSLYAISSVFTESV